jgi:DNA mismatch endonuclease (patch repair protein)
VLPRFSAAIFVHGCFWHRHPGCPKTTSPKTRPQFWKEKFRANVLRDRQSRKRLANLGWSVVTVWECEIQNATQLSRRLKRHFGLREDSSPP